MADFTLWHGDCLEQMDRIEAGSVDMILADLPFNSTACDWDILIPFEPLWRHYKRIIKPNGAAVLFANSPFNYALYSSNPEWFRYEWVWDKGSATSPVNSLIMPKKSHEYVMVFSGGQIAYNPIMWDKGQPNGKRGRAKREFIPGRKAQYQEEFSHKSNDNLRYPRSVIELPFQSQECNNTKRLHKTQKPVALLSYLIKTYTNEGETILDNTMGSGSTGEACLRTGRRFIGIEKDAGYFDVATQRLARVAAELRGELNHLPMFAEAA